MQRGTISYLFWLVDQEEGKRKAQKEITKSKLFFLWRNGGAYFKVKLKADLVYNTKRT